MEKYLIITLLVLLAFGAFYIARQRRTLDQHLRKAAQDKLKDALKHVKEKEDATEQEYRAAVDEYNTLKSEFGGLAGIGSKPISAEREGSKGTDPEMR